MEFARPNARCAVGLVFLTILALCREDLRSVFTHELQPVDDLRSLAVMAVLVLTTTGLVGGLVEAGKRWALGSFPLVPLLKVWAWLPVGVFLGRQISWPELTSGPDLPLLPFTLTSVLMGLLSLGRHLPVSVASALMTALGFGRWLFLGSLIAASADQPADSVFNTSTALAMLGLVLAFHWATRRPKQLTCQTLQGDANSLLLTFDLHVWCLVLEFGAALGLSMGWKLFASGSDLVWYLMFLTLNAGLLRCLLTGPNPSPTATERFIASFWRILSPLVVTVILPTSLWHGVGLPREKSMMLITLGLGLMLGRPWGSQLGRRRESNLSVLASKGSRWQRFPWWAALGCLIALGTFLASLEDLSRSDCTHQLTRAEVNREVQRNCGWRFRVQPRGEQEYLLGSYQGDWGGERLSVDHLSRAKRSLEALGRRTVLVVPADPGAWERLSQLWLGFFSLTCLVGLVGVPCGLIALPSVRIWQLGWTGFSGSFAALGLAGLWHWVWLNSTMFFVFSLFSAGLALWDPSRWKEKDWASFQTLGRSDLKIKGKQEEC